MRCVRGRLGSGPRTLLVLLAVMGSASPIMAQRAPESRRGQQDRAELEQRFRAHMARMIQERLGLDDAGAEELGDLVRSFEVRRRELAREEMATRRRVEALVDEDSVDPGDAGEARKLVDRLVELRARESALFAEEQAALLDMLTPRQVLQLHELRSEIGRRIRALRNRGERRGGRRGGGHEAFSAPLRNVDPRSGVALSVRAPLLYALP